MPRGLAHRKTSLSFINHFTSHRRLPFNYFRSLYHFNARHFFHHSGIRRKGPFLTILKNDIIYTITATMGRTCSCQWELQFGAMKVEWFHFQPMWLEVLSHSYPQLDAGLCHVFASASEKFTWRNYNLFSEKKKKCRQMLMQKVRNGLAIGMCCIKVCFNAVFMKPPRFQVAPTSNIKMKVLLAVWLHFWF